MTVRACVRAMDVLLGYFLPYCLRQDLSLTLEPTDLARLTSWPMRSWDPPFSTSPALGITGMHRHTHLFVGFCPADPNWSPSFLCREYFNCWVVSPASGRAIVFVSVHGGEAQEVCCEHTGFSSKDIYLAAVILQLDSSSAVRHLLDLESKNLLFLLKQFICKYCMLGRSRLVSFSPCGL